MEIKTWSRKKGDKMRLLHVFGFHKRKDSDKAPDMSTSDQDMSRPKALAPHSSENLYDDLMEAASKGDLPSVRALLANGPDVNARVATSLHPFRWTALMEAALHGHVEIMEVLISAGADVNVRGGDGNTTALHFAAEGGFADAIECLLAHGADIEARDKDGNSALSNAASANKGSLETVKRLVAHGAHVDNLSLHRAAGKGYLDVVEYLLEHGADVNGRIWKGKTPLMSTIEWGWKSPQHKSACEYLLSHGADVNARDNGGATALHEAAWRNNSLLAECLLEHGADRNLRDGNGYTPIDFAVNRKFPGLVELFKKARS